MQRNDRVNCGVKSSACPTGHCTTRLNDLFFDSDLRVRAANIEAIAQPTAVQEVKLAIPPRDVSQAGKKTITWAT